MKCKVGALPRGRCQGCGDSEPLILNQDCEEKKIVSTDPNDYSVVPHEKFYNGAFHYCPGSGHSPKKLVWYYGAPEISHTDRIVIPDEIMH